MKNALRRISFVIIVASAAMLGTDRPLDATPSGSLCAAAFCSKGDLKCAMLYVTSRDERCEEGVMCCPFPDESWVETCYELRAEA